MLAFFNFQIVASVIFVGQKQDKKSQDQGECVGCYMNNIVSKADVQMRKIERSIAYKLFRQRLDWPSSYAPSNLSSLLPKTVQY